LDEPATDGRGGNIVRILLTGGDRAGEGWGFLYEHIVLDAGIGPGDRVARGQRIGTSAIIHGNNHMGLEYLFNEYRFTEDHRCWVDHLAAEDAAEFTALFDGLKETLLFLASWRDATTQGAFTYRGALDGERFPDGPRLCYPMGTDLRVPQ
jgi:hypothetical protein